MSVLALIQLNNIRGGIDLTFELFFRFTRKPAFFGSFFLLGALFLMERLARNYFLLKKPEQPKEVSQKQVARNGGQTNLGLKVIGLLLGALPATLLGAIFPSMAVAVIGTGLGSLIMGQRAWDFIRATGYVVYGVIWLLMYRRSVRLGLRAIKEGESAFGAIFEVWAEMLQWLPRGSK